MLQKPKPSPFLLPIKKAYLIQRDSLDQIALADHRFLEDYVQFRCFVTDQPQSLLQNRKAIPELIKQFRNIDWAAENLAHTGLFKEALLAHYLLLENNGQPLDQAYAEMNTSTDALLKSLQSQPKIWQQTVDGLFKFTEARAWFTASRHLALRALTTHPNLLSPKLAAQLESYRSLAVGSTAPDLQLNAKKKLSDSKRSTLLVFGSPECSSCVAELPQLAA